MSALLACIGRSSICEALQQRGLVSRRTDPQHTPFGESQAIYQCDCPTGQFLYLPRHGEAGYEQCATFLNYRANIYALKSLGVQTILSLSETRALCHNFKVGQYVIADDLLDETRSRPRTFFDAYGLGGVRQWPVFCPTLRTAAGATLGASHCSFADRGVYVCIEGPRFETPAEGRKYASYGGELIGQTVAPEVFLARELQMCYACLSYVSRYAETGSDLRPFEDGLLLSRESEEARMQHALGQLPDVIVRLCAELSQTPVQCRCDRAMESFIASGAIGADWRTWFERVSPARAAALPVS